MDLRSHKWSLEPEKVREAQIRDEAEIPEEQRNVRLARSLLSEEVGSEPRSWTVFEIRQMQRFRPQDSISAVLKCPAAPFREIEEDTYRRSPGLHSYYSRDYEEGRVKTGPTDTYSLLSEYLTGWTYLPPIVRPRFDPRAKARQAEIKRRIAEISGMDYWTAVQVANERSTRLEPGYTRARYEKRESIRTRETEEQVENARIELLCERRGDRSYLEIPSDSSDPEEMPSQLRGKFSDSNKAEDIEEYRRKQASITIAEKLDDQG